MARNYANKLIAAAEVMGNLSATAGTLERAFVQVLARSPSTLAASADELGTASREELASLCRGRAAEGLVAFE